MSGLPERMPAIFFGHGSPMNALGGEYAAVWRALGASLPHPRAVVMVSAHWFIDTTAVTAMDTPRTIHDFYGFPRELYDIVYPAPGDGRLAERVADILAPLDVARDRGWGLDHGTWSVLRHLLPDATTPVVQLSLDRTKPAAFHYDVGRRLAALRDEGVLVLGSGNVVHNLRTAKLHGDVAPYDWAVRFNAFVKDAIASRRHDPLIGYWNLGEDARLSAPTPEHYLPLLHILAAQGDDEPAAFFNDDITAGSISMLGIVVGSASNRPRKETPESTP